MTGGGVRPEPTPEQWINSLPTFTSENQFEGYMIFTGIVNGLQNLVVKLINSDSGYQLAVVSDSSESHWLFDEELNQLVARESTGINWSRQIITQTGLTLNVHRGVVENYMIKQNIVGKLIPAT